MKKFFIWCLIAVSVFILFDLAAGYGLKAYLNSHALPGDYRMSDHTLLYSDEDLIILGSSVGLNSINTKSITDSLGITTYNSGANGQQFPFYLTSLKSITSRYTPKQIILALIPDNLTTEGKGSRYNFLIPYFDRNIGDVDSLIRMDQPLDGLFLKSNFYRLNRIWFRIFLYHLITPNIEGENGFVAKPVPAIFPTRTMSENYGTMTAEREKELREFIRICLDKGIDLTVVFTPHMSLATRYSGDVIEQTESICKEYGVRYFDDSYLTPFDQDSTLFYDADHININGSIIYTDTIINRIKSWSEY